MTTFAIICKCLAAKWVFIAPEEPTRLAVLFILFWDVDLCVHGAITIVNIRRVQKVTVVAEPAEACGIVPAGRDAHLPIETLFFEVVRLLYQILMHAFHAVVVSTDISQ